MNEPTSPRLRRGRAGHRQLSSLQKDILRTLLYFDIFEHPLTPDETFRFLPSNSVTPDTVRREMSTAPLQELLEHHDGYVAVRDSGTRRVGRMLRDRPRKEKRARRLLRIARFMGRVIGSFPFVRAVFVTGELSKGVAVPDADIDFVVVTRSDRLWIARTLLIGFKKAFLFDRKRFFCLNHIISEANLEESGRNIYAAVEVGTVIPLVNPLLHARYLERNTWIASYFPNLSSPNVTIQHVRPLLPGLVRGLFEWPLAGALGETIDRRLLETWRGIWRKRYPELTDAERERLFRCERNVSTAYAGDFQPKVLRAYEERLRRFDLKPVRHDG